MGCLLLRGVWDGDDSGALWFLMSWLEGSWTLLDIDWNR